MFEAAITRTSTFIVLVPPTRCISCSWSARRTFACVERLMSAISSRNIVPPCASSNLPFLCAVAPVKEPFSCPKSSDSIKSSGMAAQFIVTNGPDERSEYLCIALATNSFPVPFSPKISTRPFVGPARKICSLRSMILGEFPIIEHRPSNFSFKLRFSSSRRDFSSAFFTERESLSSDRGFSIKSYAPSFTAFTAVSIVPCPDMTMTGRAGAASLSFASVSIPSIPGIQTSRSTKSGNASFAAFKPSAPLSAVETSYPSSMRMSRTDERIAFSSSIMRMWDMSNWLSLCRLLF